MVKVVGTSMTHGYLLTFFTQHSRHHDGQPLASWIVEQAIELGIRGATLSAAEEGFGHDGRYHSSDYFGMEDPPQKLTMAVTAQEAQKIIDRLEESKIKIFFTKAEIEFGFTCESE